MSTRLEILKGSLAKKNERLNAMLEKHYASIKEANGQPLNDKRNGQATRKRWERQDEAIRNLQIRINNTLNAIEAEEHKQARIEQVNETIPIEIMQLVQSGELIQWKKHPNIFFVKGVKDARITWDVKRKVVAHSYVNKIQDNAQWVRFAKIYNELHSELNNH